MNDLYCKIDLTIEDAEILDESEDISTAEEDDE